MNQERVRERKGTFNGHEHNHAGQHSVQMRLEAAREQFFDWLRGKAEPPKNPFLPPEVEEGGLVNPYLPEGEGTEIVLFTDPLTEVRQELSQIQNEGNIPSNK